MDMIYDWPTWVLVVSVLALMFAANEIGYRLGRVRHGEEPERAHAVSNALKASILGLVALLLGFSFSITSSRFQQRQRLVLDEANAIGTCYLRAELLAKDKKAELSGKRIRESLRSYTNLRLEHFERALESSEFQRTTKAMDTILVELWSAVEDGVTMDHELARTSQIVPAANEVIDLSATRAWASHNHLPPSVLLLLAACMGVSSGLMGHSSGQVGRRHLGLWIALNVLVMLVLFVVLDFDRPRRGLIQVNHAPLIELRESMRP
jgi:hypothetical protein